jgi:hypothetical protein
MLSLRDLLNGLAFRVADRPRFDFERMLHWKILRGSHEFPGPDGGTCVNEAAIVASGYPYRPVRRIEDCPASFSRPLALYAMCLNEIVLSDTLRQELLMPFVTRLAGSADQPEIEMARVALIVQKTVATILPEALARAGYQWEAERCRSADTIEDAIAAVRQLCGRNWYARGPHLIGLINTINLAVEDFVAHRAIDAAQYAGTAIADVAEVITSIGGDGAKRASDNVYRQGAAILDAAVGIGRQAAAVPTEVVAQRLQSVKRTALIHQQTVSAA